MQGVLLAFGFRTGLRVCSRGWDRFWGRAGVGFGATEVLGGVMLGVGDGVGVGGGVSFPHGSGRGVVSPTTQV